MGLASLTGRDTLPPLRHGQLSSLSTGHAPVPAARLTEPESEPEPTDGPTDVFRRSWSWP